MASLAARLRRSSRLTSTHFRHRGGVDAAAKVVTFCGLVPMLGAICLGALVTGCNESRDCERKRLDLFQAWQEVNKTIEERKLTSGEPQWTAIQSKVDVLQSAFATTQVTWDSANKNREEAVTLVGGVTDTGQGAEIFRATFNAAGAKQAAYYESCH